jgi:hypothetical protein
LPELRAIMSTLNSTLSVVRSISCCRSTSFFSGISTKEFDLGWSGSAAHDTLHCFALEAPNTSVAVKSSTWRQLSKD